MDTVDPASVPRRTLYTGAQMPAIGLGTFGSDHVDPEEMAAAVHGAIVDPTELALIAKLAEFPRIIESAAQAQEPHRIAFYLYDLASFFHGHWNKGKDFPELRFVNDKNRELSIARLGLVHAVASVLKSGLGITGTAAPAEMR